MIDQVDINDVAVAIVRYIEKNNITPTVTQLANVMFLTRGAVENRIRYMRKMGLVQHAWRQAIHLTGEMYLPPPWVDDMDYIIERLPEKNRRLARSK
jgi:hypothetical protein